MQIIMPNAAPSKSVPHAYYILLCFLLPLQQTRVFIQKCISLHYSMPCNEYTINPLSRIDAYLHRTIFEQKFKWCKNICIKQSLRRSSNDTCLCQRIWGQSCLCWGKCEPFLFAMHVNVNWSVDIYHMSVNMCKHQLIFIKYQLIYI